MVMGTKLVKADSMGKVIDIKKPIIIGKGMIFKKAVLVIFILLLMESVFAQKWAPLTEEQIEKVAKDLLLDIPIQETQAIESAKEEIGTYGEPAKSLLGIYTEPNETEGRLVWNMTFDEPDNKEVLVDAVTGEVLSVKTTIPKTKVLDYLVWGVPIIAIFLVVVFLLKKRKSIKKFKLRF